MSEDASEVEALAYAKDVMGKSTQNYNNKSWLIETVVEIINTVEEDLNTSEFKFEDTAEAAEWNTKIIEKHDNDFVKAVQNENNTILTPWSEFRSILNIEKIWQFRENWSKIESILTKGCICRERQP